MIQAADDIPNDAYWLERGRLLFAAQCTFQLGVVDIDGLPEAKNVEIAFAGRSNVGKSSLINTLTNRKMLARVSNTPGRTRELNFFELGSTCTIVDMPGYGYARASRGEIQSWTQLIRSYLAGRSVLARVILLIDARHGIKSGDEEIMALLDTAAVSFQVVLTKADKPKPLNLEKTREKTALQLAKHPAAHPRIHETSSFKKTGLAELRAEIAMLVER